METSCMHRSKRPTSMCVIKLGMWYSVQAMGASMWYTRKCDTSNMYDIYVRVWTERIAIPRAGCHAVQVLYSLNQNIHAYFVQTTRRIFFCLGSTVLIRLRITLTVAVVRVGCLWLRLCPSSSSSSISSTAATLWHSRKNAISPTFSLWMKEGRGLMSCLVLSFFVIMANTVHAISFNSHWGGSWRSWWWCVCVDMN